MFTTLKQINDKLKVQKSLLSTNRVGIIIC